MYSPKSEKVKARSYRFEKWFDDEVISHMKRHNITDKTKGVHSYVRSLKKEVEEYKSLLTQNSNSETTEPNANISEKRCSMMVYIDKRAMCGDPEAPISAFMKSHLNAQVCALCRKLRKKLAQEVKEKEQQEVKQFHEQRKKNVHNLQKRVNETIEQEEIKETLCPHLGVRVLLKKCERCLEQSPNKYTACQQHKEEQTSRV